MRERGSERERCAGRGQGDGVDKDERRAVECYRRAADIGVAQVRPFKALERGEWGLSVCVVVVGGGGQGGGGRQMN